MSAKLSKVICMTATTSASGATPAEEPERPFIKLSEAPYPPIRWLADADFWKNVTVNVYSAAIVGVFTVTIVSIAQMIKDQQQSDRIIMTAFAGLVAMVAPPLLTLFTYGIRRHKQLPKKERLTTVAVFAVNILLSLGAIAVVIIMGVNNIING